jgi:hypothetical protein
MSHSLNDEASDTDAIGSPDSDTVYGALISEQSERAARATRLDFSHFTKVPMPCTDKSDRAANPNDEASDTDVVGTPKLDIVYGALISEQIEREARDTRLDYLDFDKVTVPRTDKSSRAPNRNDEMDPMAVTEIQEADIMLEESMSEQIDRAAREAGLDVYDSDHELVAGSDKSGKANSSENNSGSDDDSANVFEDMESVHSDDMFDGFDQTIEERIEGVVRRQRSKRHLDDEDAHAAMQAQAMIEQQEREEGAKAKRRKENEIGEAAAAAAMPAKPNLQLEHSKVMPQPIRNSIQDADVAEKTEKSGQEQKQEQKTVQPSQQTQPADVAEKTETSDQEREQQLDTLQGRVAELQSENDALKTENERLKQIITTLESNQSSRGNQKVDVTEETGISDEKQKQGQTAIQPSRQANVSTTRAKRARITRPKILERRYQEEKEAEFEDMLAWTENTTEQWTRHRNHGKRRILDA